MRKEQAHISESDSKRYLDRSLQSHEIPVIDRHLAECDECYDKMIDSQDHTDLRVREALFELDPSVDEHLDYDQLAAYVDGGISDVDREIADVHKAVCTDCSGQLADLFLIKESLKPVTPASQPVGARPITSSGWPRLSLRFAIPAFAVVLIAVAAGVWFLISSRPAEIAEAPQATQQDPPSDVSGDVVDASTAPGASVESNTDVEPEPLISVVDGGGKIAINSAGHLTGLNSPRFESRVKAALNNQAIDVSSAERELRGRSGVLMSGGQPGVSFGLTEPVGKIVVSNRPQFRWQVLDNAESYVVTIFDSNYNKVAESPAIQKPAWTAATPLKPGTVYQWQVTAVRDGEKITSPVRPAPDARFKVLDAKASADIAAAKRVANGKSHLLLGIAYANAGLLNEAEREFRALLTQNPRSEPAKRLLQKVRSAK